MAYPNEVFSAFAFIGFFVSVLPLYWHLEAWNVGTCMYMIWSAILCLNQFINSIIWNGNAYLKAKVFCDISVRILAAGNVAIPACALCIMRRLYTIASVKSVLVTQGDKRRAMIQDLCLTIVLPIVYSLLSMVNQGHRFDILEDIGCGLPIYLTPVSWALYFVWPLIIGITTAVYCALVLFSFYKRSTQFSNFLSSGSNLTMSRYFRLMALASVEMLCTIPYSSWLLYINATTNKTYPWISWADTHSNYGRIVQWPRVIWSMDKTNAIGFELSRWAPIICAFFFFMFFGFAAEARKHYRLIASSVSKKMGVSTSAFGASLPGFLQSRADNGELPSFVKADASGKLPHLETTVSVAIDFDQEKLRSASDRSSISTNDYSPSSPRPPMPFPVVPAHHAGDNAV